jgi:Domain of unknown function (DUF222)
MFASDTSDPLDLVREGLDRLAAEDRSAWSPSARSARLLELREVQERAEAEVIRSAAGWVALDDSSDDSRLGPTSWLAARSGMTGSEAARLVRAARLVHGHERTGRALATGQISPAQVHLLASAGHDRSAQYREFEPALLDAARKVELRDFVKVTRRWRELADDEESRRDAAFAFERRGLTLSPTIGGSVVSGFLDPEAAAIVGKRLEAQVPPDPNDASPARTRAQRWADALVELFRGDAPDRAVPAVDVLSHHEVLAGHPLTDLESLRCDIESFGPIPRVTLERLACDCTLSRVMMRTGSEVLDYGRRTRTVPPRLRRLVRIRDEHCQYPGCRAPASWCDVHHVVHWLHGGGTNLGNLALLCRRHHVACHEGGWKLARGPDGLTLAA